MPKEGPRISVNKLGEYLVANALRRRAIIKAQKEPPSEIVPRYQKAFPHLEQFFLSGNQQQLELAIDKLRTKPPKSPWEEDDNNKTADALESFLGFAEELGLDGWEVTRADPQETAKLLISGVEVSVRPDFYLRSLRGKPRLGTLKFHFPKSHDLTTEGGTYVATTLHQFLEVHQSDKGEPHLRKCLSIDVFRKAICLAPKSYSRIRGHLSAACEEIALRWNSL